jgi:hypothetical protein
MDSLFISYALGHYTAEYVTDTFNMTFDGDVVAKISETTRVDTKTHKPFKMFWIEINPNRRMVSFLDEIKTNGWARLYFTEKGTSHYWQVQINNKPVVSKPRILPRIPNETLDQTVQAFINTEAMQKRIAGVIAQDEAIAFKEAEQTKLVQTAEQVLEPEIALKRFLEQEKIDSAKRLDVFMASQGETAFQQSRRHYQTMMEGLIQC